MKDRIYKFILEFESTRGRFPNHNTISRSLDISHGDVRKAISELIADGDVIVETVESENVTSSYKYTKDYLRKVFTEKSLYWKKKDLRAGHFVITRNLDEKISNKFGLILNNKGGRCDVYLSSGIIIHEVIEKCLQRVVEPSEEQLRSLLK